MFFRKKEKIQNPEAHVVDASSLSEENIAKLKGNLILLAGDTSKGLDIFFENSLKGYLNLHLKRNSFLKTLLHRTQPVYFFDIYQPITLEFDEEIFQPETIEDVFGDQHLAAVIGDAGSGKSMFGKFLFLTALNELNRIPLIIELRYLDLYSKTLYEYIHEDVFDSNNKKTTSTLDRLLKNGKFLLILDGFDEIGSDEAAKVKSSINTFIEEFPHNYYLLSSRPYAHAELLPGFSNFSISPLTGSQIESFIIRQNIDKELAENAIRSIKEEKNDVLTSFLQNPLLLSLYLLTYKGNSNIPDKKSIFYRRVIDTLFKEHDSLSKFGFERPLKSKLNQEQIEVILQAFSFISYCEGKFGFTKDYIIKIFTIIKESNDNLEFSIDFLLDDLRTNISLLIEDGNDFYFAHRSLQEYFAVLYVNNIKIKKENIYQIIQNDICSKGEINESRNFLQLLIEVEEYEFNKFLLLPNLEKIKAKIEKDTIWSIIKAFVQKISFSTTGSSVKFVLTRVNETYAFIFDLLEFPFIKEFEAFLLSDESQKYFSLQIHNFRKTDNESKNPRFEIVIESEKADELRRLFSNSIDRIRASELFLASLNNHLIITRKKVDDYTKSENMAISFLLSQNKDKK